jgi:endonuclease III-like uncharacterized protein
MSSIIKKHEDVWGEDPRTLLKDYKYQPKLTKKLDNFNGIDLDRETFYELILWKTNRWPDISCDLIKRLRCLTELKKGQHKQAKGILEELLKVHGVSLPMASTILRFLNSKVFQIIDERAFRVLMPIVKKKYPSKGQKVTDNYLKRSCEDYFYYLDTVHKISCQKLPFESADRILYLLDIKLGNKINQRS